MANKKISQKKISIRGMHCRSCAEKIESRISQLDGVEKIRVSLADNNAIVRFDPDKITAAKIKSEISALGYDAGTKPGGGGKGNGFLQGLLYGLIPHIGCIAFVIGSILGVTVLMQFFKPVLMNRYFFHILILVSLLFATLSSMVYLRRNGLLSWGGAKRRWKYLAIMYGSTIGINLILFVGIFPLLANVSTTSITGNAITGAAVGLDGSSGLSTLKIAVDLPCPGHAPLVTEDLKTLQGLGGVQFSFPNVFDIKYDPAKTSKAEILGLGVFRSFPATVLEESQAGSAVPQAGSQLRQPSPLPAIPGAGGGGCGCGAG